jgi:hypothetical protein
VSARFADDPSRHGAVCHRDGLPSGPPRKREQDHSSEYAERLDVDEAKETLPPDHGEGRHGPKGQNRSHPNGYGRVVVSGKIGCKDLG